MTIMNFLKSILKLQDFKIYYNDFYLFQTMLLTQNNLLQFPSNSLQDILYDFFHFNISL